MGSAALAVPTTKLSSGYEMPMIGTTCASLPPVSFKADSFKQVDAPLLQDWVRRESLGKHARKLCSKPSASACATSTLHRTMVRQHDYRHEYTKSSMLTRVVQATRMTSGKPLRLCLLTG